MSTPNETYEHAYPPRAWDRDALTAALATTAATSPVPTATDRDAWEAIRTDDGLAGLVTTIRETAADAVDERPPPLSATDFLAYERTGQRGAYSRALTERCRRLTAFTLATCLDDDDQYRDVLLDETWALCECSMWSSPANEAGSGLPVLASVHDPFPSLGSTRIAKTLAELAHLLGDRLHPDLLARIDVELERRMFGPYLARDDFWWLERTNNWNAVCNGNILTAGLYAIDESDRLADVIVTAAGSMYRFLQGFDATGGTGEGISYLDYGFRNYVTAAIQLEARLGRTYSLLSPPVIREIARLPLRVQLSPNRYPPFADAPESYRLSPWVWARLADRFDEPTFRRMAAQVIATPGFHTSVSRSLAMDVRTLAWCRGLAHESPPSPPPRWSSDGFEWWVVRTDADDVVVAAKGGDNAESHNHADCGSFVVHVDGESLLTDLGKPPTYPGDFWSRRYDYLEARSLGHSVPYVNGHEQASSYATDRTGPFAAAVLDRSTDGEVDRFVLDLAGCYPDAAGLDRLRRSFAFDRGEAALRLTDEAEFSPDAPGERLQQVLITDRETTRTDGGVHVAGDAAAVDVEVPDDADVSIEVLEDALIQPTDGPRVDRTVWRTRIRPSGTRSAMTISRVDA